MTRSGVFLPALGGVMYIWDQHPPWVNDAWTAGGGTVTRGRRSRAPTIWTDTSYQIRNSHKKNGSRFDARGEIHDFLFPREKIHSKFMSKEMRFTITPLLVNIISMKINSRNLKLSKLNQEIS